MITLRTISEASREIFFSKTWEEYRVELLGAGFTNEQADTNIDQNRSQIFTDGVLNDDQHIFDVFNERERVGTLWLASKESTSAGEWFIYDIVIEAAYRGKGLGKELMLAAEEFVKSNGGTILALNVFGPNTVARNLYESLDYKITRIGMKKHLS